MNPTDKCRITNRSTAFVVYTIPERNIRREFNVNETKEVPFQEILDVSAQPGGRALFHNYLYIHEPAAVKEAFNLKEEPEYYLTATQIPEWINTCSLDEFKDALDFAPQGVKDLIKKVAVDSRLNDVQKRLAIKNQLGFDVETAIKINQESQETDAPAQTTPTRRVKKEEEPTAGRRTTPNYKVVKKD